MRLSMNRVGPLLKGFMLLSIGLILALTIVPLLRLQQLSALYDTNRNVVEPLVAGLAEVRYDFVQIQQFMTDTAATGNADSLKEAAKARDDALARLDDIARLAPPLRDDSQALASAARHLYDTGIRMAAAYQQSREAGNAIMQAPDGFDAQTSASDQRLQALREKIVTEARDSGAKQLNALDMTRYGLILLCLISLAVVIIASWGLYRSIFRQLGCEPVTARKLTQSIADGDFTHTIKTGASSENSLLTALVNMQSRWRDILSRLNQQAQVLQRVSVDVGAHAHSLSGNSRQQTLATDAIASATEQLSVAIDTMLDATRKVEESGESALQGEASIRSVVNLVTHAATTVGQAADEIQQLDEKIVEIDHIVQLIRDVADQTNLLALNAAIEAARAGESGRGFAVVADEVRKLAERTATATESINRVTIDVTGLTRQAVRSIHDGAEQVQSTVSDANQALAIMSDVRQDADTARSELGRILAALSETRTGALDIARRVEQVASMTANNHQATENLASTTDTLNATVEALEQTVAIFRLPASHT
ncbi:hypothetical protein DAI18_04795 [Microvirgula aerodenitrificans]|uniref:Methyl-accepting transducer domain-containing protein n=2 Tax=Microvirgula aerodenitrificans TaxID=57480 RepID=A0A2S0P823_9NEIS|nr:hypothetical protein DAI18_04795 [Microvirgula aerodenitrificans]